MIKILKKIDKKVIEIVNKNRNTFLDEIMLFASRLGNAGFIWIFIALILLSKDEYHFYGIEVLESMVVGSIICNLVLKPIFERTRPYDKYPKLTKLIDLNDYSFPSGHTLASFSSATVLLSMNLTIGILALLLASLIAYSRLYLNVHYFTDVFFGMILGIVISLFIILI